MFTAVIGSVRSLFNRAGLVAAVPKTTRSGPYSPHPWDIEEVSTMFTRELGLPAEITDLILEYAWCPRFLHANREEEILCRAARQDGNDSSYLYLVTEPIPFGRHRRENVHVRGVRFRTISHDQGWGGDPGTQGTYNSSWTWLEASILPPTRLLDVNDLIATWPFSNPNVRVQVGIDDSKWDGYSHISARMDDGLTRDRWRLHSNKVATSEPMEYDILWEETPSDQDVRTDDPSGAGSGKQFCETLRSGDRIAIWARAKVHPT